MDTDINGDYIISNLNPDNYNVVAGATGFQSMAVGASVIANTTTTVNFSLSHNPGSIAGKVTNVANGDPIPGASINILQGVTIYNWICLNRCRWKLFS